MENRLACCVDRDGNSVLDELDTTISDLRVCALSFRMLAEHFNDGSVNVNQFDFMNCFKSISALFTQRVEELSLNYSFLHDCAFGDVSLNIGSFRVGS